MKLDTERKMVTEMLQDIYVSQFEGVLKDTILFLIQQDEKYSAYKNVRMSFDEDIYMIWGDREENDFEYNKRMELQKRVKEQAKKQKIARVESERKTYERLKVKFENEAPNKTG